MPLLESEAITIRDTFDTLPEDAKPLAAGWLKNYKDQQDEFGLPMFPSQVEKDNASESAFFSMFDNVKNVDPENGLYDQAERLKAGEGDRLRMREAGMRFLAKAYGDEEKVRRDYPLYRDDFALKNGGKREMGDGEFYSFAGQKVKEQQSQKLLRSRSLDAGFRAAIEGGGSIEKLAAARSSAEANTDNEVDSKAFLEAYQEADKVMSKHSAFVKEYALAISSYMDGGEVNLEPMNERLLDLPGGERRIVLAALRMEADKVGEKVKGSKGGKFDLFAGKFLQQTGEAAGRLAKSAALDQRRIERLISAIPETGEVLSAVDVETPEDARRYVRYSLSRSDVAESSAMAAGPGGFGAMPVDDGAKSITLSGDAQKLIQDAKEREFKRLRVANEIRSIGEAADPIPNVFASTIGTSGAALSLMAGTRGLAAPALASAYTNIEFNDLSLKYPQMSTADKMQIAAISGAAQAALDYVGVKALYKLPGIKSLIAQPLTKQLAGRALALGAVSFGLENLVEAGQDIATPALMQALKSDVPGFDWEAEQREFWKGRADVAIGLLPLTLLGIGAASVNEYRGAKNLLSWNDQLGAAGVVETDRVAVIEAAQSGDMGKAQSILMEAWGRRNPEVAAEYQDAMSQRQTDMSRATAELERLGAIPTLRRDGDGWTVTSNGTSTKFATWEEARDVATAAMGDMERAQTELVASLSDSFMASTPAFLKGESVEFNTDSKGESLVDRVNAGAMTPEQAMEAAVAGGVIKGVTMQEARAIAAEVFGGQNASERAMQFRQDVEKIAVLGRNTVQNGQSRSIVNAAGNERSFLTVVEEVVEGRWKGGLERRAFTKEQGVRWVQLAESATGETFLKGATWEEIAASAELAPRALTEAISRIVVADVLGRMKDGKRIGPGTVSSGLNLNDREQSALAAILDAFRKLFKALLETASKLAKARQEGKLGGEYDALFDALTGGSSQLEHDAGATQEADAIASEAVDTSGYSPETPGPNGETFSISSKELRVKIEVSPDSTTLGNLGITEGFHANHGGEVVPDFAPRASKQGRKGQYAGFYLGPAINEVSQYGQNVSTFPLNPNTPVKVLRRPGQVERITPEMAAAWRAEGFSVVVGPAIIPSKIEIATLSANVLNTPGPNGETFSTQARAKSGGEFGPNGEWYQGGAFIATTELPKKQRDKLKRMVGDGLVEVSKGNREKQTPGMFSPYRNLVGVAMGPKGNLNEDYLSNDRNNFAPGYVAQVREAVTRWSSGEMQLPISEFPLLANATDLARAIDAGVAISGEVLNRNAWAKEFVESYSPTSLSRATPADASKVVQMPDGARLVGPTTFSLRANDSEYMRAVESGGMEKAQAMVDEAARAAGYDTTPMFHGVGETKFNVFKTKSGAHYFTPLKALADGYSEMRGGSGSLGVYLKIKNPFRGFSSHLTESRVNELKAQGYDGATGIIDQSDNLEETVVFSPDQIKSADPVTYDDAGNVIPLSQRFNPADNRITFSLRPGDFAARMEAKFALFSAKPELRMAVAQVAKERAMRLGAEWIEKGAVIRSAKDIDKEQAFREASGYDERIQAYLDSLTPNARQTLEFEPEKLEGDPLISAMLDFGRLMSFSTAKKNGKVEAMSGDYDGQPWLPPAWFSKGAGIMPDQMAQAMFDAGLLPDAYTDTLWAELGKRIESTLKDKAAHREAVQAYKDAQKAARTDAKMEAEAWANQARKTAGSAKAQREMLKAALRTLDGILAAAPPEVRAKVGGYVKIAGLATDEAMLQEIERRIEKLNRELEKWLKKEAVREIEKLLKKGRPDMEAGKKGKGRDADMHALFAAAEAASVMDALAVAGRLADLDARIASGELTPEQEVLAMKERGIVELIGDLKSADAGRAYAAMDALKDVYTGGWLKWKLAEIERKERRAGMRQGFIEATGKKGIQTERDAAEKFSETLLGKAKGAALSLSSFHEVMAYAFGETSGQTISLVDAERAASGRYEDANQKLADEVESFFASMAGSTLKGEKLRYSLAQKTIKTAKGEYSQLQAIQALLMWNQEDGRRHMEGTRNENNEVTSSWSYDQAWIDEVEVALTPEARRVMGFISAKYSAEWSTLNPLYRARYGVNLPQHDAYAPITVAPAQAKAGEMIDPISGGAVSGSGILTPGSLRTRSRSAIAEPKFHDALQVLLAHSKQMEYWRSYYDLASEMSAVLGNNNVMNSVEAKGGKAAREAVKKWIDAVAMGGFRDSSASLEMSQILQRMSGRAATVGLVGRFSTLLVQSTQIAAASVKMPVGSYIVGMSKLLTGNLGWKDAIQSDFIQRRYKSAPPIVRQAMDHLSKQSKPNAIKWSSNKLGQLISGADAFFTSGTYALLLDYHRKTGAAMGLAGAELETHAHTEAERATEQVAQPTRMTARSLMEVTSTNPLAKVSWAYASEARQKIALAAWAAANAKNDPARFAKTAFLVFGVGGLMTQVLKNAWREMKGDDDEKKWSIERLTVSALTGPLHGIPGVSELRGDGGMFSGLIWAKPAVESILSGDGDLRDVDTVISAMGMFNDNAAAVSSMSHLGLDAAKLVENLAD